MTELSNKKNQSPKWLYFILLSLVVFHGMAAVLQVQHYRHDYREKNKLMAIRDELNAERGRLLIEQQTFGATAQIGTRAVSTLQMFAPPVSQTVVIPVSPSTQPEIQQ